MRISRQPSQYRLLQIKTTGECGILHLLGSTITNVARGIREITSRIVMTKAALNRKKTSFANKLNFNLRKK